MTRRGRIQGQSEFARKLRERKGCCPTHGLKLNLTNWEWLTCPRLDCDYRTTLEAAAAKMQRDIDEASNEAHRPD